MSRAGWLLLILAVAAGGAVAAVPRPPVNAVARAAVDALPVEDPFPIRRVRGTDARLPELLKELDPGPVVRLPRAEFESRVRAAGRAVASAKQAPRVGDARYVAELDGSDLVGTAELGVLNPSGVTGFVPLDPLRLAVRGAKWADGGPAVLAVPVGTTAPAVWLDRAGRRTLQLDWSLTGTTEPGERRFELRVPPCPTSALELELPIDQVPTASADVLLTGPFDAPGKPAKRLWRLRFGGRARLEFAVRAAGTAGGTAQAKLVARYDLAPGQLTAAFEYELHPARGSAGEWAFTADPGLRVTDVVANNRAAWTVDPPTTPNGPRRVRVTLRQPGPGGKVLVTAVAPFPDPARPDAPLPAVRPLAAVLDEEKLEVRLAPGLKVESFNPGDYRLTDTTNPAPGAADPARVLALVGTLVPPGVDEAFRRTPTVRAAPAEADFVTHERLAWELDPVRSVLVARVTVRVRRGPLFQLAVRPPPNYTLDRGASAADEFVSHIGSQVNGQYTLEFARPLASGQQAEVRLEFRGPGAKPGAALAFPALAVAGAAEREGWLSVSAAPGWAVVPKAGAGAAPGGLWGWLTSDAPATAGAVYLFRGKEPDGTAALVPARPAVTADALVRLDTAAGHWVATTRFNLAISGGALSAAVVLVPDPEAPGRSWKLLSDANAITDAAPVPAALLRAGEEGTVWVLRFARPLEGPAVIETTAPGPAANDDAVSLRVPRLLGAEQKTRAEVGPALKDQWLAAVAGNETATANRKPPDARIAPAVSDSYLVTAVRAPGEALAAFGGTVRDSKGGVLRVALPPGAEARAVCVAGRWLTPGSCSGCDTDGALRVPVPAGAVVRFEVRYRLPVPAGWPTRRAGSPVPELGGGTPPVRRWWLFAAGTLPGWPSRPWNATADEPPLLGGALLGEPPALVTRSDDEWVRVGEARTADALACGLAAATVVFGLVAARRRRKRGAVALAAAVVLGLLVAELGPPWWARAAWPPVCATIAALAVVLAGIALRRSPVVPAAVAASAAAVFLFALAAPAQPPAPATVLVLPTPDGGEEVVAARAVLDRLDALAKPHPPAAVVTSAAYAVRVEEGGARVAAKFVVHAFRSADNAVALQLGDVRLEGATVDGAPAFPAAPQPSTYVVEVGGPGRHEVELRFAAPVTANGPERDVRFATPEVPEARFTASLPGGARQPVAVGRVGRQVVATGGERATLEADLGAAKTVHLRWREGAAGAAVVKVREACIWDVTESGADLTAAYLVRVEQGTVNVLRFDVPAELEVLRVAARTLDAPVGPLPLRDWAPAPEKAGGRVLRVDFQAPVSGRLLVVVECAPRKPLTRQPVLRFPRVNFGGVSGEVDSVYGIRASRVAIDGVGLGGVLDFPADALKDFAAVPDLRLDPAGPVRAFRPVAGTTPELRPALHVGEPATVRTSTAWHVGPHRADATGTVSWQAKEALPLVEFNIGPVKVLEVRGPEVSAWHQSGGRVQVWLRAAAREGAVEWTGTVTPPAQAKPTDPVPFDPVHPHVVHARHAADAVRVKPADGFALKTDRAQGWQSLPASPGELRFHTDLPAAPPLRVQLLVRGKE